ncbi:hypothetical protein XAP412_1350002 [Xanthomonas phaseoli pv. phaseoli]|uniref:Transposase n=1 Tax=Xanthomonas campestris pv. phaseoli TaxID=317013 RepID=A0AB38DYH2_XANCH|nr:hypothetical protein XAP6984_1410002 [Xanthomonas phaseoli pv. phaseoli]SON80122.1 hypothetical protein XAP412_1350002 [Xanthomonas phaseoli pv. phaseoli]SON83993.1 hypothetical protein XAP7430_1550003 [Xanthomonas phaseoli pv. phaseoli]SOO31727.1 hypothetical protein XAP6164_5850001 [Xanthomonas phaseoli pv. phaseoli]
MRAFDSPTNGFFRFHAMKNKVCTQLQNIRKIISAKFLDSNLAIEMHFSNIQAEMQMALLTPVFPQLRKV